MAFESIRNLHEGMRKEFDLDERFRVSLQIEYIFGFASTFIISNSSFSASVAH